MEFYNLLLLVENSPAKREKKIGSIQHFKKIISDSIKIDLSINLEGAIQIIRDTNDTWGRKGG